jgi:microcompartment protein CcmL/EutN
MIFGPAIATFELSSISKGYFLLDQLVKKAESKILEASAVSPGKFFILINGDEASVGESRKEVLDQGAQWILDEVFIPQIHNEVIPGLYAQNNFQVQDSLAIVETATVASGLLSADAGLKAADVHLVDFRMARGIGGKAYFFLAGTLDNVQAAVDESVKALSLKASLIRSDIIANPHEDFLKYFNIGGL